MLDRHLDLARISRRQPSTQGLIVGANECPMICLGPHLWRVLRMARCSAFNAWVWRSRTRRRKR